MFDNLAFDEHERVVLINDEETGLRAIIALHSTSLGPAGGGCRLWHYENSTQAITDALRLSKGMSYKNAIAGLAMGGGKTVIMGPIADSNRKNAFRKLGRAIESLSGAYVAAEDVGVTISDMQAAAQETEYVSGLSDKTGAGGDPSPYTALGVRLGIEAVAEFHFGRSDIDGLTIAVQGLGSVGSRLCDELARLGARLLVADIDREKVARVCNRCGATPAEVSEVLLSEVDIVAPCALGGAIDVETAEKLQAGAVAGAANNQIASSDAGRILANRGITYAPDYVINAGGIIAVAAEYFGQNDRGLVQADIGKIRDRTKTLLERSKIDGISADQIADKMAQEIISRGVVSKEAHLRRA